MRCRQNGQRIVLRSGAMIFKQYQYNHPAVGILRNIANELDDEKCDGTTTFVLLVVEFLNQVKLFVEKSVHLTIINEAICETIEMCLKKVDKLAEKNDRGNEDKWRESLENCAASAMHSSLTESHKTSLSKEVLDAVLLLDDSLPSNMISFKFARNYSKHGSEPLKVVRGVAFKRKLSHGEFRTQPETHKDVKIELLKTDFKHTKNYDRRDLKRIHECGAKVVLSKFPIDNEVDLSTAKKHQYRHHRQHSHYHQMEEQLEQ